MTDREAEFWVFVAGKGGVGRSVIAYHVAAHLASQNKKVLLLDTDLGLANLPVLANTEPGGRLERVLAGGLNVEEAVTPLEIGCDLLAADSGQSICLLPGYPAADALGRTLSTLTARYDYVLVDTPRGLTDASLQFCRACDLTVLVTTGEPTSLTNTYAWYKLATVMSERFPICLVANQSNDADLKERFNALCQGFLGHAPIWAGSLPADAAVPAAVARQEPVFKRVPDAPFWRSAMDLAENLQAMALQPVTQTEGARVNHSRTAGKAC